MISSGRKSVVFDLDDTLFRERDFCRSGFRFLEKEIEKTTGIFPDGLYDAMNTELINHRNPFNKFEEICRPIVEETGCDWDLQCYISSYRNHYPEGILPIAEMIDFLDKLFSVGVILGLITDGRSITQRNKIKALGIKNFFPDDNIIISEEFGYDKLSPEPFLYFMRKYPDIQDFTYVGDNPGKDIIQPKILGWKTILIPPHPDNVHSFK